MSTLLTVAVVLVMVLFNALFVAAEFATVGSRRSRVQQSAEAGSTSAGHLLAIMRDPKTARFVRRRLPDRHHAQQPRRRRVRAGPAHAAARTPPRQRRRPHGRGDHRPRDDHRPPSGAGRVAPQDRRAAVPRTTRHRDPPTDADQPMAVPAARRDLQRVGVPADDVVEARHRSQPRPRPLSRGARRPVPGERGRWPHRRLRTRHARRHPQRRRTSGTRSHDPTTEARDGRRFDHGGRRLDAPGRGPTHPIPGAA